MGFLTIPYPAIDPVALHLGPIAVKWYGLAYVAGLLLGWWYARRLLATPSLWPAAKPPLAPEHVDDLFIWVALGVVIGGRLGHVLLYEPAFYLTHPLEILKIWRGGMAFHGGMLGVIIAMYFYARLRGVQPLSVMDIIAAAVPFGLFFGRVANFINAEVVGRETTVPWGVVFPGWGPNPRHPSQIYEALLEGAVLWLVLRWLTHHRGALARPGEVGGAFVLGYGAFRLLCELFKIDEYRGLLGDAPITMGMLYSFPMVAAGAVLVWRARAARKPA